MLTLKQIEHRLDAILGDTYGADPSVRYTSFFRAASALQQDIIEELYHQEDEANQQWLTERQATGHGLEVAHC